MKIRDDAGDGDVVFARRKVRARTTLSLRARSDRVDLGVLDLARGVRAVPADSGDSHGRARPRDDDDDPEAGRVTDASAP
jgi:hypothetical protein